MSSAQDVSFEECDFEDLSSIAPQPQSETLGEYFKNGLTNLVYNLRHSNYLNIPKLNREKVVLNAGTPAYMHGELYTSSQEAALLERFRKTLWISYRKNIKTTRSDAGWGCMIRVVQMMLAEVCQRTMQLEASAVIDFFRDDNFAVLSLTRICSQGQIEKRWTQANEVIHSCQRLLPRGFAFDIHNESSGCLIPEKIKMEPDKQKLIVVHTRLGLQGIESIYVPHLKALMELSWFAGCLAGASGEALYILGYCGDNLICMDPHYVQEAEGPAETYFKTHPRGINWKKLSPSISICLLVKDEQDFANAMTKLLQLEKHYTDRALNIIFQSPAERCRYRSPSIINVEETFEMLC